jgi:hypothetical protein
MESKESIGPFNPTPLLYYKDFYTWSESWMGEEKDRAIGDAILQEYVPFIESLVQQGLAKSTIKKHMLNLCVLGSEIIGRIQDEPRRKKWPAKKLLLEYLDDEGGPLTHCWDPNDDTDFKNIMAYDSVCRKLYMFIKDKK